MYSIYKIDLYRGNRRFRRPFTVFVCRAVAPGDKAAAKPTWHSISNDFIAIECDDAGRRTRNTLTLRGRDVHVRGEKHTKKRREVGGIFWDVDDM